MPDRRTLTAPLGLFLLAPLVAEYLLGNTPITLLPGLIILAPLYGGPALLIREAARHTGRGWPTIILLSAAFGLVQAGLVDQSLFNPSYGDDELLAELRQRAYVAPLGLSAQLLLTFVVGHAVWSISVPIALVETFAADRATAPWLGRTGLAVTVALYLAGSALIFVDHQETEDFMASPGQLLGTTVAAGLLVAVAFGRRGRRQPDLVGSPPRPWLVGVAGFLASSTFVAIELGWVGVVAKTVLLAAAAVVVDRWSGTHGWGGVHRLALAGGALLTYAWISFVLAPFGTTNRTVDLLGDIVFALGAAALLMAAARHTRQAVR